MYKRNLASTQPRREGMSLIMPKLKCKEKENEKEIRREQQQKLWDNRKGCFVCVSGWPEKKKKEQSRKNT